MPRQQFAALLGGAAMIGMGLIAAAAPQAPDASATPVVVARATEVATLHDMATTTTTTTTAIASYRPIVTARIPPPPTH